MKKLFSRLLALLLACVTLASVQMPAFAQETAVAQNTAPPPSTGRHTITKRYYTAYLGSLDKTAPDRFSLYFMDGVNDLPYVELYSWVDMLLYLNHSFRKDPGYKLSVLVEDSYVILERENKCTLELDFENELMIFEDYDSFIHKSSDGSLIDLLGKSGFNDSGDVSLFKRSWRSSFDRYGDFLTVDLKNYGIDLIAQDGKFYMPLQTMNDFLLSLPQQASFLFNGQALFFANDSYFYDYRVKAYTPYAERYYTAPKGKRSVELANFSYNELCLVLDTFYGLKEPHEIDSIHRFFWQIEYDEYLSGTSAWDADITLKNFINYYLDDLHSGFNAYSYLSGKHDISSSTGLSNRQKEGHIAEYEASRKKYYPKGCPDYEEIGDTAFVTLDSFTSYYTTESFYGASDMSRLTDDTIGLIVYAHGRIMRKGSPIKKVVLDLSNNTGGAVDAALFLMGWVMGDAPLSIKNTATGAMSTAIYRADVNLDRVFDEKDTLAGKKVYCLISPVSFSCGNSVPAAFKSAQAATIIGRTSGGGSCIVQNLTTAHGSVFQISSAYRMSFLKNGSFYDIDQGVDPDYYINDIAHFYDRKSLVKYLNSLY